MKRFSDFLIESLRLDEAQHGEGGFGLDNDSKGKLHELLVGKFLMHPEGKKGLPQRPPGSDVQVKGKKKKPPSEGSDALHARLKASITPEEYGHHERIAKFAAAKITAGLQKEGHIGGGGSKSNDGIAKVHWTSNPSDIASLTGKSDKANNSDIVAQKYSDLEKHPTRPKTVIETDSGKHIGISLKVHNKPKMSGLANLGHGKTDSLFHVDTQHHAQRAIEASHNSAAAMGLNTRVGSNDKSHDMVKKHPEIQKASQVHGNKAAEAVASAYHDKLKNLHPHHLTNVLSNVANVKPASMPLYRSGTYGSTEGKMSHEFVDPHKQASEIFAKNKDHMSVTKGKGAMMTFKGKGDIPIASLNVSRSGSSGFRPLRSILQGFASGAKHEKPPAAPKKSKSKKQVVQT